jgi:hypothetical protein
MRSRYRFESLLIAGAVFVVCAATSYAGVSAVPSLPLSGRVLGVFGPYAGSYYSVAVEPDLGAGEAGWTGALTYTMHGQVQGDTGAGVGSYPTNSWPFIGASEYGPSLGFPQPTQSTGNVVYYVLTGPTVAAVRAGNRRIETSSGPKLPVGDRAAVFFAGDLPDQFVLPGFGASRTNWLMPFDSRGRVINAIAGRAPNWSVTASTFWESPAYAPPGTSGSPPYTGPIPGACELSQHGLAALTAESGHVIKQIRPVKHAQGEVFLSCIDTTYDLDGSQLEVAVLVNAKDPGHDLGPIPGARAVPNHPDTVNVPAGSNLGSLTARRIGQAWLVVQGGASVAQRLTVLHAIGIHKLALAR